MSSINVKLLLLLLVTLAILVVPISSKKSKPTPYPSNWKIDPKTHPYVAPKSGDRRGPCPMLNVLANHGYIPHNGLATPEEIIAAAVNIASLGIDTATFLVLYEFAFFGDILNNRLSIGQGGLNNHGGAENDASLTRDDYYFHLDCGTFNKTLWKAMKKYMEARPDSWSPDAVVDYRTVRFNQSLATNPNLWFSPVSLIISAGAGLFLPRVFTIPGQSATTETISSIFKDEKLFDGFGKQAIPVTIPEIVAYALYWLGKHPMPLSPLNIITNPPSSPECLICLLRNAIAVQVPTLGLLSQGVLGQLLDTPFLQCTAPACA